jgi:hypothetical protein
MALSNVLDAPTGLQNPNSASARDRQSLIHPTTDLVRMRREGR